jgi:hypothetical protein
MTIPRHPQEDTRCTCHQADHEGWCPALDPDVRVAKAATRLRRASAQLAEAAYAFAAADTALTEATIDYVDRDTLIVAQANMNAARDAFEHAGRSVGFARDDYTQAMDYRIRGIPRTDTSR